jgi:hypothetical protein
LRCCGSSKGGSFEGGDQLADAAGLVANLRGHQYALCCVRYIRKNIIPASRFDILTSGIELVANQLAIEPTHRYADSVSAALCNEHEMYSVSTQALGSIDDLWQRIVGFAVAEDYENAIRYIVTCE